MLFYTQFLRNIFEWQGDGGMDVTADDYFPKTSKKNKNLDGNNRAMDTLLSEL